MSHSKPQLEMYVQKSFFDSLNDRNKLCNCTSKDEEEEEENEEALRE